jgi:hypothetical protein
MGKASKFCVLRLRGAKRKPGHSQPLPSENLFSGPDLDERNMEQSARIKFWNVGSVLRPDGYPMTATVIYVDCDGLYSAQ